MAGGDLSYRDISTGGSFIHRETSQVTRSHAGEKSNQVNFFFFFFSSCYAKVMVCEQRHCRRLNVEQMSSIKYSMIKAKALETDTPANDDE